MISKSERYEFHSGIFIFNHFNRRSGLAAKLEGITAVYDDLSKEQYANSPLFYQYFSLLILIGFLILHRRKALADRTADYMNQEALTQKTDNDIIREGTLYLEKEGRFSVY